MRLTYENALAPADSGGELQSAPRQSYAEDGAAIGTAFMTAPLGREDRL